MTFYGIDYPEVVDLGPDGNEAAPEMVHRGQARIAYRLAQNHAGKLLHVHGIGWHYWDGTRWREDDRGEATRSVLEVLRLALAASLADKGLREDVRRCESATGIAGVLSIAAALPEFAVTVGDLDADPYLVNVANGTLDLRTMNLRPHDPADRITKACGALYRPDAVSGRWDAFLARVLPEEDVREFLRRYAGLALCGTVLEHVLALLTGTGRNGKSVFTGALAFALGDYAGVAEPDLFMHRDGAHPTGEFDLRGLRWVTVSETDAGRKLAEATVKRLTGGDHIKARRMRQDFVTFTPSHTPVLVTNHLPRVSGDDPALWARLRVVPFDVVIPKAEQNPHLAEELQADADAILAWAVAGWRDYTTTGLAEPATVQAATDDYQTASDALTRFVDERCLTGPHFTALVEQLWEAWCQWLTDDGGEPISKRAFGQALDKRGYDLHRGTGGRRYRRGIGLQSTEGDDQ